MNDCYRQTSQCRINWKLSTRVHASHSIETSAVLLVRLEACAFICNLVSITLWILHIILCGFRSHYLCQQTTHGEAKICVEISNERESSIWTQTWRKTHTGKESSIRHLKYSRQTHSFVFIFRNSAAHYVDFTSIFPSVYKNRAEKKGTQQCNLPDDSTENYTAFWRNWILWLKYEKCVCRHCCCLSNNTQYEILQQKTMKILKMRKTIFLFLSFSFLQQEKRCGDVQSNEWNT